MNKRTEGTTVVLFAVVMMGLAGCATKPDWPEWVENYPTDENYIYGIGVVQMTDAELAWETATDYAWEDLAYQIGVGVKKTDTGYEFTINPQALNAVLTGLEVVERYEGSKNMYYVLARYPRASMKTVINDAIQDAGDAEE
jgi:hypothetical protein